MKTALALAAKGRGRVFPNPMVGCIIVKNGKVIGKGWHEYFGGPHAEINALKDAGADAKGADMYVTLEPCCHYGKTPPCTDAVIRAGIYKVYAAMKDPNPAVSGCGLKKLSDNSIKIYCGIMKNEAITLNSDYLMARKRLKRRVIIKAAMTLDGKIASRTGDSKWITSPESREKVHILRAQVDGILIGIGTVIADNPRLTSHGKGRDPVRIVLDPHLDIPIYSNILKGGAPAVIFHGRRFSAAKADILRKRNILLFQAPENNGVLNFKYIINKLNNMSVNSILIEGGGETIFSALSAKIADEVMIFIAPKLLGGRNAKTPAEGIGFDRISKSIPIKNWKVQHSGPDILITGKVR